MFTVVDALSPGFIHLHEKATHIWCKQGKLFNAATQRPRNSERVSNRNGPGHPYVMCGNHVRKQICMVDPTMNHAGGRAGGNANVSSGRVKRNEDEIGADVCICACGPSLLCRTILYCTICSRMPALAEPRQYASLGNS